MPILSQSLQAWGSDGFVQTLKQEMGQLAKAELPLAEAVTQAGYVGDEPISVTVLSSHENAQTIHVKLGVFFTEIVICCGCGDDPMPINTYTEMQASICKNTGTTAFTILPSL